MSEQTLRSQDVVEVSDYEKQKLADKANQDKIMEMLKTAFPNLYLIGLELIEPRPVNAWVLVNVARALGRIAKENNGKDWGRVVCEIQNGKVIFVKSVDVSRINDFLLQQNYDEDIENGEDE